MWTAVKILAVVCASLLTLIFIAILVMTTRPALLMGVSGDGLARSIAGGNPASDGGGCTKRRNGDWKCWVHGPEANGTYLVDVNWMGCWTATPVRRQVDRGNSGQVKGCIELGDIITFN